jgi:hypothetical protein
MCDDFSGKSPSDLCILCLLEREGTKHTSGGLLGKLLQFLEEQQRLATLLILET